MSGKNKTNPAAEAVAGFTKVYNDALEVQANLPEDATKEQIDEAQATVDAAKTNLDEAIANSKETVKSPAVKAAVKEVKVKILLPVAGKFLLPYNVDQVVKLPEAQATELVEAKYAEFVK